MVRKITLVSLLWSMLLLSIACGLTSPIIKHKDFTRPNYETIRIGETGPEVLDIMGRPTTCITDNSGGATRHEIWIYTNDKPYYQAAIEFEGGLVKHKHFTIYKSDDLEAAAATTSAPTTKPAKHHPPRVL